MNVSRRKIMADAFRDTTMVCHPPAVPMGNRRVSPESL
jgi:hypothetical protein